MFQNKDPDLFKILKRVVFSRLTVGVDSKKFLFADARNIFDAS